MDDPRIISGFIIGACTLVGVVITTINLANSRKKEFKQKAAELLLQLQESHKDVSQTENHLLTHVESTLLQSLLDSQARGSLLREFLKFEDPEWAKESYLTYRDLFDIDKWKDNPEDVQITKYAKLKSVLLYLFLTVMVSLTGYFALRLGVWLFIDINAGLVGYASTALGFIAMMLGITVMLLGFPILFRMVDYLTIKEQYLKRSFKLRSVGSNEAKIDSDVSGNYSKLKRVFSNAFQSLIGEKN